MLSDYVGHEGALAGIDLGAGGVDLDNLLIADAGPVTPSSTGGSTGPGSTVAGGSPGGGGDDLLAGYLTGPSVSGGSGADDLLGTDGPDWLAGLDGDDRLSGGAGNDVLEGGGGDDVLEGGAGDDRYLFNNGEPGFDTIRDTGGTNHAELKGYDGADVRGVMVGNDLWVVVDFTPLFAVEGFANHQESFSGVKVGDSFVPTEDLLA